jgi:hypothetical protein
MNDSESEDEIQIKLFTGFDIEPPIEDSSIIDIDEDDEEGYMATITVRDRAQFTAEEIAALDERAITQSGKDYETSHYFSEANNVQSFELMKRIVHEKASDEFWDKYRQKLLNLNFKVLSEVTQKIHKNTHVLDEEYLDPKKDWSLPQIRYIRLISKLIEEAKENPTLFL